MEGRYPCGMEEGAGRPAGAAGGCFCGTFDRAGTRGVDAAGDGDAFGAAVRMRLENSGEEGSDVLKLPAKGRGSVEGCGAGVPSPCCHGSCRTTFLPMLPAFSPDS